MTPQATGAQARRIVVAGDVTIDWNIARDLDPPGGYPSGSAPTRQGQTRTYRQIGGAALVAQLLTAVAHRLQRDGAADVEVATDWRLRGATSPTVDRFHHSYALWSPQPYERSERGSPAPRSWRVEQFLGFDRAADQAGATPPATIDPTTDVLLVLDDADLGFRRLRHIWLTSVPKNGPRPWVLLKMARPVAQGPLWKILHRRWRDRLVVVVPIDDLRLSEVQISRQLSWEQTAQDVYRELVLHPNRLNALADCAHVVISFGTAGALLLARASSAAGQPGLSRARLIFDPQTVERGWEERHPGSVIGYTTCLVAALARQIVLQPDAPNLDDGVQAGVAAMRLLHREGYGQRGATAERAALAFPIGPVADEIERVTRATTSAPFTSIDVRPPVRTTAAGAPASPHGDLWSILQDRHTDGLTAVAERIVEEGAERVLPGVPSGRFGRLYTVDRREIEGFQSIQSLIREYDRQKRPPRPLSIAVFGAPGSGKSFGVTEVAGSILGSRVEKRTFNLSQFSGPDGLRDALHQVRDISLSGKLPLIFWDEFDSQQDRHELAWLHHFLAPMQDGEFQDGQITHKIGPAIFVFAGGTCRTMEQFVAEVSTPDRRALKGPDFVSRLKGYVNIIGPDPDGDPLRDPFHVIRRAIVLRTILLRDCSGLIHHPRENERIEKLAIDPGVLRAFLTIDAYRHGVRSMESIVAMSQLAERRHFERSCLPSPVQLDLHVDGEEFSWRTRQPRIEGACLRLAARETHQTFREVMTANGYTYGTVTTHDPPTSNALVPWEALPPYLQRQNEAYVQELPLTLRVVGCDIVVKRPGIIPHLLTAPDVELMAEREHARWAHSRLRDGWSWGAARNDTDRLHPGLLAWAAPPQQEGAHFPFTPLELERLGPASLPEHERVKDRALIAAIPRILARIGYCIVGARTQ